MKKNMLLVVAALALAFTLLPSAADAQSTNAPDTNSFIVTLPTNTVVVPAAPAVTESSLVVDRIIVDNVLKQVTIYPHGLAPIVWKGAKFAAFKAAAGPGFRTVIAGMLANP